MPTRLWKSLFVGLIVLAAAPASASDVIRIETPGLPSVITVERRPGPQQLVLSVRHPNGDPIVGLGPRSFTLGQGIRKARVLSVEANGGKRCDPINSFKTAVLHKYLLTYELLNPVVIEPKGLRFDLPVTSTGRPATSMVFFHTNRMQLPEVYARLNSPAEAEAFRPETLAGDLKRYFNILNFIGKTLRKAPEVRLGIIGCNSDTGPEKNNLALSQGRAESVKNYLHGVWGIAAERMRIESRNLPADPSPSNTREGRLENQRVEFIFSSEAVRDRVFGNLMAEAEIGRAHV